jgi:SAM-dependent methyltransferase
MSIQQGVNLPRKQDTAVRSKDPDYIHYYFLLKDIKDAIDKFTCGDLLDLGCGNKPYEEWYRGKTTSHIGCDVIQSSENKVDVLCMANQLPFESGKYDTVLCTQVLEHVYDHHGLVKEAYRVSKKNGTIILTVPFVWELHEEPYDFFRITKHGLKSLFDEAGFEIVYIKANGGKWAAAFQMFIRMVHSTFKNKSFKTKLLKILFLELQFTRIINKFAIWADKKYFDDQWTLNYIVVAKKTT